MVMGHLTGKMNICHDIIFKAIGQLKTLKGIFQIDYEVSQKDPINELTNLHNIILKKQKDKGKYFISFLPIIKRYFELY